MWLDHGPLPEFPGRLRDKHPHPITIPILPLAHEVRAALDSWGWALHFRRFRTSPILPPSAVCLSELQESAAGHRYFHAHRDCDLHPDQRGLLHHPPHQCNLRQRSRSRGKCVWPSVNVWRSVQRSFTPFNLLFPDVCRPGVCRDELDDPLGRGSLLLRGTQRLHSGILQVSDYVWLPLPCRAVSSQCLLNASASLIIALLHVSFCVSQKGCSSWGPERATCLITCAWSMSTATLPSPPCSSTSVHFFFFFYLLLSNGHI